MYASSWSNTEILGCILGNQELARKIEFCFKDEMPNMEKLLNIRGIGFQTAQKVMACYELSSRFLLKEKIRITQPEDILCNISWLKYETQENFICITMNSANNIINCHKICKGLVNQVPVHPREAFKPAILDSAVSVIFAHNHPSGSTHESDEDVSITRVLCAAGKILQIPVLDHVIISKTGFNSLCRKYPEFFEQCLK